MPSDRASGPISSRTSATRACTGTACMDRVRVRSSICADVARLVHELHQMMAGLHRHRYPLPLLGPQALQAEQFTEAEDGVQRGAQLVTEPVEKLLLGVVSAAQRLVSLPQGPVGLLQVLRQGEQVSLDPLNAALLLPGQLIRGQFLAARLVLDAPGVVGGHRPASG